MTSDTVSNLAELNERLSRFSIDARRNGGNTQNIGGLIITWRAREEPYGKVGVSLRIKNDTGIDLDGAKVLMRQAGPGWSDFRRSSRFSGDRVDTEFSHLKPDEYVLELLD